MKKKIAALLAITTMLGIGSTFAADPFDSVDKNSWEYRHIRDLADDGIISGYPANEMHSKRVYTRIELAEMVYAAIKNIENADVSQKADIIELAKRYKKELDGMAMAEGAKGFDLKKVMPIEYGSVRMRYMHGPVITDVHPGSIEGMVAKVGPDVDKKYDKSEKVDAYLVQEAGVLKDKLVGIESAMATPQGQQAVMGQAENLAKFLSQSTNKDISNKAKAYLAGNPAQKQAILSATMNQLKQITSNPELLKNPAILKRTKDLVKALPIINDFDRQKNESQFDTRLRLNVFGILTPRTKALARIEVKQRWDKPDATKVHFDRLMLVERLGKVDFVIGRQGVTIGSGLTYNDFFDGVLVSYRKKDTRYTFAHGWPSKFYGQYAISEVDPATMGCVLHANDGKVQATYLQVSSKFGHAEGKVYYMRGNDGIPLSAAGLSLDYNKNKFWVGGEYAKLIGVDKLPQPYGLLSSLLNDDYAWIAGVGYGDFDNQKAGTWNVKARYLFEGRVAPVMNNYTYNQPFIDNYKGWNLEGNYTIKKDLSVNIGTFFDGKSVKNTEKYDNVIFASLNYNF